MPLSFVTTHGLFRLLMFGALLSLCFLTSLLPGAVIEGRPFASPLVSPLISMDWVAQESGALANLSAVFFIDRERGWIVGSNGTLLLTEDGGSKWRRVMLGNQEPLRDVRFLNAQRGLVLGEYGLFNRPNNPPKERSFLLASIDGGLHWEDLRLARRKVKSDDPKDYQGDGLMRFVFADEQTGWACGETGLILATKDGGQNWQTQISPTRKLLYDVTAINQQQAWIVGTSGIVLRTMDGGQHWSEQVSNTMQTLRAAHFIDAQHGWAVGVGGTIIATVNGGQRWHAQSSGVDDNLNSVFFTSANEGWAAGDHSTLLHTLNGGATWERIALKTRTNLTRLFFIAPDCGWVVGASGTIFKYQSTDGTPHPSLKKSEEQ